MRSSREHFVKTSALRWVCLTLLAEVPWASRVWSLPFLSALAYSERYAEEQGKRQKDAHRMGRTALAVGEALAAGARNRSSGRRHLRFPQALGSLPTPEEADHLHNPFAPGRGSLQAGSATPPRAVGKTASQGRSPAEPLSGGPRDPNTTWTPITVADCYGEGERIVEVASATAVWHSTGLPAVPLRWVLIRDPQEEFDTQALLCTDLTVDPGQIISWFVRRWQMEATFQEVRQRLGFETQRHCGRIWRSGGPLLRF